MSSIEQSTFSRLVRLSNIFGLGDSTATDFKINLNRMTETNNIVRAVVKSVSFTNSGYNIFTDGINQNNEFKYEIVGSNTYTATVTPSGFYSLQQLIDIIKPQIEANAQFVNPLANFTMVTGSVSKKVEYSIDTVSPQIIIDATGTLNKVLGNLITSVAFSNNTYVSEVIPNLYGLTNVYIHSTAIGEGNLVDGDVENHDVIANIPVNVPFGSVVHWEANDDELVSINYRSLRNYDSLSISLRDIKANLINLNGGDCVIILKIYYL